MRPSLSFLTLALVLGSLQAAEAPRPLRPMSVVHTEELPGEGCTSVMVTRSASVDGATMTSHSCDSTTDRTWMTWVKGAKHPTGSRARIFKDAKDTKGPLDPDVKVAGEIPQASATYGYLNAAYPIMNEHQLAIGETTIGGRRDLVSQEGILDAPELFRLALERAKTAREAIQLIDQLTREHGYNDAGESFTFADTQEVWLFEIYGPGKGRKGAVWAAQRVPEGHVSVSANASRIRQLDLKDTDQFMASANVFSLAKEMGWWKEGEVFDFAYAYAPASRTSVGCRIREWRVLSLLAPSLKLDPQSENHPFSVKPERKVSVQDLLAIFRDHYEGTPFDQTAGLVREVKGQWEKSPIANPFAPRDLKAALKVQPQRTIAVPQATYVQVTQSRGWLPAAIGGVVWLAYDNPVTSVPLPVYVGAGTVPAPFTVDGRREYRRDCAWWAFRTASKLSHFRWQDMVKEVVAVRDAQEKPLFASQAEVEAKALALHREDPRKAAAFLAAHTEEATRRTLDAYWKLSDQLWVKFGKSF